MAANIVGRKDKNWTEKADRKQEWKWQLINQKRDDRKEKILIMGYSLILHQILLDKNVSKVRYTLKKKDFFLILWVKGQTFRKGFDLVAGQPNPR